MDEFKERQRAMWAAGDYAELSEHIRDIGEKLVDRVGVEEGMDVLDVACGTGNAAFPAARAGGSVTGLDLVPELLEAGRRKAASEGVVVSWVEGDAEELPFEDDAFDRVLSTVGHMFAPRHRRTADEMARVCRSGGIIGICCWTPEGSVGDVFRAVGSFMPPPPEYAAPPILWGTEDHVRDMLGDAAADFAFERHVSMVEWDSPEGFAAYFMERFGPLVTARQVLGDERFGELRERILAIWREWDEGDGEGFRLPQEYLLSVVTLR